MLAWKSVTMATNVVQSYFVCVCVSGQCEREGPVVSGGLLRVDLQNNLSHDPHGRSPDQSPSEEEESSRMRGGGGELFQQDSLNNNEDEDVDHVMLEEEEEGEESESSSVTRGQSPDTPMTDSSFSDTGKNTHRDPRGK